VGLMLLVACSVAALVIFSYRGFSRLRRLAREAPRNAEAVRAREAGAARVAELNEMTVDLESSLKDPAFVPRSCARAALALGTLVALIQVSQRLAAGIAGFAEPLLSFCCGVAGMMACSLIGRWAEAEARGLRNQWNALIRRSLRDVAI
jgi:hypothetical protein